MAIYWPWLAVAGVGALHALNPASGWMFAAAWGVKSRDGAQVRRALMPIAIRHAASVALVIGLSMDRVAMQVLAGALLVGAASYRVLRGAGQRTPSARRSATPASRSGPS